MPQRAGALDSWLAFAASRQGILFGCMAGALTMTLRIIRELWFPVGGAYNVDGVLAVMVRVR